MSLKLEELPRQMQAGLLAKVKPSRESIVRMAGLLVHTVGSQDMPLPAQRRAMKLALTWLSRGHRPGG